jgi:hypothetical protein
MGMRTSSSPPATGLKMLTSPTPTAKAGMVTGYFMTSGATMRLNTT